MPCFDVNTTAVQTKEYAQQLVDVVGCKLVTVQGDAGLYVVAALLFCFLLFGFIVVVAVMRGKKK